MMKVAHYTDDFSLHQTNLADELYSILGDNFKYFEMCQNADEERRKYQEIGERPYLVRVWRDDTDLKKAREWAVAADVVMFATSETVVDLIKIRLKKNLLTFEGGERWFKKGLANMFSPLFLHYQWLYHTYFFKKPIYKLCASAYGANDQYLLNSYKGRCYKWGYFTKVGDKEPLLGREESDMTRMMWCARFIDWKHPELPVKLAAKLKEHGYRFTLDMFGGGVEMNNIKALISKLGVGDVVRLNGNRSNDDILGEMRNHDIFLFTSDRKEGWGAVLNEAMSNGCAVVASSAIGSVPFLVKDGINGMIFKDGHLESLNEKVEFLINNPSLRKTMVQEAFMTMRDIWSPRQGALNFIKMSEDLLQGRDSSIQDGPCSKAFPI